MKATFVKTYDESELTTYDVFLDGERIGELYRDWGCCGNTPMSEWGLDSGIEKIFGENCFSGHNRVQSLMAEMRRAALNIECAHLNLNRLSHMVVPGMWQCPDCNKTTLDDHTVRP